MYITHQKMYAMQSILWTCWTFIPRGDLFFYSANMVDFQPRGDLFFFSAKAAGIVDVTTRQYKLLLFGQFLCFRATLKFSEWQLCIRHAPLTDSEEMFCLVVNLSTILCYQQLTNKQLFGGQFINNFMLSTIDQQTIVWW